MPPSDQFKQHWALPAWPQCLGGWLCVMLVSGVSAQETKHPEAAKPLAHTVLLPQPKIGEATQKLLELQGRGTLASDRQYPMPVAVAEKVYQRYVNSFAHPIPEKLDSTLQAQK